VSKPTQIYFREFSPDTVTPALVEEYNSILPFDTVVVTNWNEFSNAIAKKTPCQIVFHPSRLITYNVNVIETVAMMQTVLRILGHPDIPIAVTVDKTTTLKEAKIWKKLGIFGLVAYHEAFSVKETMDSLNALFHRIPYWPKHLIDQLQGNKPKSKNKLLLTDRQQEVFNLIATRGLSNKQIATTLHISESTVKLHITEIFKKHGVRTRTQLAVFSHS
jgi:two-component system nitrate/nitrite response regulator NarP